MKSRSILITIILILFTSLKLYTQLLDNSYKIVDKIVLKYSYSAEAIYNYSYYEDGKMESYIKNSPDGRMSKYSFIYDSLGYISSELTTYWYMNQWVNQYNFTYNYDSVGNKILELREDWVYGKWENEYKYEYTYDSQSNKITESYYRWGTDNQFTELTRLTSNYDSLNNKILDVLVKKDGDGFINDYKISYRYNSQGNIISYQFEDWYWLYEDWLNQYIYTYEYDSLGYLKKKLFQNWHYDEMRWQFVFKDTNIYDINNSLIYRYEDYWDDSLWVNSYRHTFSYDDNGDTTTHLTERWDIDKWTKRKQTKYNYDSDRDIVFGSYEEWNGNEWVESLGDFFVSESFGNFDAFTASEINVFYSLLTDINEKKIIRDGYYLLQNYPNPFNPTTTISYTIPRRSFVQLKVYNILGNEVASLVNERKDKGNYEVKFDALKLSSGIYFYRLQTENFKETKKLILLK